MNKAAKWLYVSILASIPNCRSSCRTSRYEKYLRSPPTAIFIASSNLCLHNRIFRPVENFGMFEVAQFHIGWMPLAFNNKDIRRLDFAVTYSAQLISEMCVSDSSKFRTHTSRDCKSIAPWWFRNSSSNSYPAAHYRNGYEKHCL